MWFQRQKRSRQNFPLQDDGFSISPCFAEKLPVAFEPVLGHSGWQRCQCYWPCGEDERARFHPGRCLWATPWCGLSDLELRLRDRRQVVPAGKGSDRHGSPPLKNPGKALMPGRQLVSSHPRSACPVLIRCCCPALGHCAATFVIWVQSPSS